MIVWIFYTPYKRLRSEYHHKFNNTLQVTPNLRFRVVGIIIDNVEGGCILPTVQPDRPIGLLGLVCRTAMLNLQVWQRLVHQKVNALNWEKFFSSGSGLDFVRNEAIVDTIADKQLAGWYQYCTWSNEQMRLKPTGFASPSNGIGFLESAHVSPCISSIFRATLRVQIICLKVMNSETKSFLEWVLQPLIVRGLDVPGSTF